MSKIHLIGVMSRHVAQGILAAAVVMAVPALASAAAITGNLALSSTGTQVIAVSSNIIDFNFTGTVSDTFPPVATSGALTGSGSGTFDVGLASTGSFAPLTGSTVTVHNLDSTQQPTGSTSGPGLPLSNFVTFSAESGWSITLTQVLPGVFGNVGCGGPGLEGDTCTPANSPFNLANIAGNQVSVSFAFSGFADDGLGNQSSVSGTFGTTFSNTTLQDILAAIGSGNAVVTSGTATIAASAVPEPGSVATIGLGMALVGLMAIGRRLRARKVRE